MTWTTAIPTEPGWYWFRPQGVPPDVEYEIARIKPSEDSTYLMVETSGRDMTFAQLAWGYTAKLEWYGPIPRPDDAPTPSELEKLKDEVPSCHAIDVNWCINYAPKSWHVWVDSSLDAWWAVRGEGATLSDAIAEARKQLAEIQRKKD